MCALPIKGVLIETDAQVETLRVLRNMTRLGFSHDTNLIEADRQRHWWATMRRLGWVKAWLYQQDNGAVVGYGLLRAGEDVWWNSLAVDPHFQGLGYGSFITRDLIRQHNERVYSSVRRDNPSAIAMHHLDDWEQIDGPDESLVYFRSRVQST